MLPQILLLAVLSPVTLGFPSPNDWKTLNASVQGKLFQHAPYARSCFTRAQTIGGSFNAAQCAQVQQDYLNPFARVESPASFEGLQWEGCPATGEACLLDSLNPTNPAAFTPPAVCHQGSVPSYFIEVLKTSDVQAAFAFARKTGVELVIKNTGHDYFGRSARPNSLALWTRHLNSTVFNPSWIPTGCPAKSTKSHPVGILGSGVDLVQLLDFSEANGILIPGGACGTVSPTGGYVLGGGHSALSNRFGLAVDRALQFTVVVPTGEVLIANECQNKDLFFALRGGGGGTFGLVLEVVSLALPRTPLQAFNITNIPPDAATHRAFWKIVTDNSLPLVKQGWGGYVTSIFGQFVNPTVGLTPSEVKRQMAPIISFAKSVNATIIQETMPSFAAYFDNVLKPVWSITGSQANIGSRLIPRSSFATAGSRAQLLDAVMNASAVSALPAILITTPFNYKPDTAHPTSVTPAWREAVWHFVLFDEYTFNTTVSQAKTNSNNQQQALQVLRDITPSSGAYNNEAHLHEPGFEESFWGSANFARLSSIKKKYDPHGLLDCWHCIGWKGASDPRYKCYP